MHLSQFILENEDASVDNACALAQFATCSGRSAKGSVIATTALVGSLVVGSVGLVVAIALRWT